jgi:hypothetical protein
MLFSFAERTPPPKKIHNTMVFYSLSPNSEIINFTVWYDTVFEYFLCTPKVVWSEFWSSVWLLIKTKEKGGQKPFLFIILIPVTWNLSQSWNMINIYWTCRINSHSDLAMLLRLRGRKLYEKCLIIKWKKISFHDLENFTLKSILSFSQKELSWMLNSLLLFLSGIFKRMTILFQADL